MYSKPFTKKSGDHIGEAWIQDYCQLMDFCMNYSEKNRLSIIHPLYIVFISWLLSQDKSDNLPALTDRLHI